MLSSGFAQAGGPAVETLAKSGNPHAYNFPVPMKGRPGCDFSFSGLKTAVREQVSGVRCQGPSDSCLLTPDTLSDICASFQRAAADSVCDRAHHAMQMFTRHHPGKGTFVLAGGVAANQYLRGRLEAVAAEHELSLIAPPVALCTDNAAMIAWAGIERFRLGMTDGLDFEPRARWPLTPALVAGSGI